MADKTKAVTVNDAGLKSTAKRNSAENPSKAKGSDGTGTMETSRPLEEKLLSKINFVFDKPEIGSRLWIKWKS